MNWVIYVAVLAVFIQGCSVTKQLIPTGGSKADGIVKLSFEYAIFEEPQVDFQQGANNAKQRCAAWGYSGADAFGGLATTCINFTRHGCNRWLSTIEYQCTGVESREPSKIN